MAQDVNIKINVDANQAQQSTTSYKKTLKDLQTQMVELQVTTNGLATATDEQRAQYAALEQQAGQLSDAISDVSARVKANADDYQTFNAVLEGLKGGAAVAQGLVGTLDLLGLSNTGVEKVVTTLMSLQGIMNSLNTVQQIFNKDSKLRIMLDKIMTTQTKEKAVAEGASATALTAEGVATTGATVATRSFTAALMSNPIFLMATVVAGVTAALISFTGVLDEDTESLDENSQAVEKNTEKWHSNMSARRSALEGLSGGLIDTIENKGLSVFEREAAMLEFVTSKLGVQVNSIEEARKVYNNFTKTVGDVTMAMDVIEADGTKVPRYFTTIEDAAISLVNAQKNLKEVQQIAENLSADADESEKIRIERLLQTYESYVRYAQNMYDILERKTVGYYKKVLKQSDQTSKETKETIKQNTEEATGYIVDLGEMQRRINDEVFKDEEKTYEGRKKHYEEELRLSQEAFEQEVEDMKSVLGEDTEEYQTWLDLRETMLSQHLENVSEAMQKNDEEEAERRKRENEELQAELDRQEQERIEKQIEREQRAAETREQIFQGLYSTLSSLQEAELADENLSEKEKLKIQKKYAISNLLINLAETGVALATSIPKTLEAYADIPFAGPILAAVQIAATTASVIAQIAKINQFKQQISKAANGAFVTGPSHANGGVMMELEGGEAVINRRAMAIPEYRSLASAMNVSTGGVPFPNSSSSGVSFINRNDLRMIVQEITSIPVVVSEQSITDAQRKVNVIEGRSRF